MQIRLLQGDITRQAVNAIVNAANTSLLGGGGVDGAIHRAGGPAILAACREIRSRQGGCPVGEAVFTTGGDLPCQYVIHTVGPRWKDGKSGEDELLASCYRNALLLAEKIGAKQVAFPNISTGIYGFPKERAAAIAIRTVNAHAGHLPETVIFVCFDADNYTIYQHLLS